MTVSAGSQSGGTITDEGIAKMRLRIGIPVEMPPPFNLEAHPDTMRHFAYGYGDDNPLYFDPEYGRATRWGTPIGPPTYVATLGRSTAGPMPADIRERSKGALAGIGMFYSGSAWEFVRPVRPGDRVSAVQRLVAVEERMSSTFGARAVRTDREIEFRRESDGCRLAVHRFSFFHVERGRRPESSRGDEPPWYSDDEIEVIEADILGERRRGQEKRFLEDVAVGDPLGVLTKGPLRVSDILAWHMGNGPGEKQWGALRVMSKTRKRARGFFNRNEYGAWDLVQRLHWDGNWARTVGLPRPYDYGAMRNAWLGHLVTDWMGDDAWMIRLQTRIKKFNYQGDLTRVSGVVSEVQPDGTVVLSLSGVNQRGEETCTGTAVVGLPSRSAGLPRVADTGD